MNAHNLDVAGKHIFITGGGGGLGLALAKQLIGLGPNISLVTKDLTKIVPVVEALSAARLDSSQRIVTVSADLSKHGQAKAAFDDAVSAQDDQVPDWVFLCAGFAQPSLFSDLKPEDLSKAFDSIYMVHAHTVYLSSRASIKAGKPGNIVMVSSLISRVSCAGYSGLAPARYALRGLYDSLKPELAPMGIRLYFATFPGSFGDAFDQEDKTKSQVTRQWDKEHGYAKLDEDHQAKRLLAALGKGDVTDLSFEAVEA